MRGALTPGLPSGLTANRVSARTTASFTSRVLKCGVLGPEFRASGDVGEARGRPPGLG